MKLSEVSLAKDLVDKRRMLVVAYVDVATAKEVYVPYGLINTQTAFGYVIDDPMREAIRTAVRDEIRSRIKQCDDELAALGVVVDGIAIEIKREEASRHLKEVEAA
ncbi:hypothetical protein GOFOIKOB_4527 [Methylobacterium tardum]|uniref:Uncharacterized protein n=1 Tax=Methylobacterium tardum TaxID=374432 RepID=A0AA37TGQ1_9HYPH|nr:hypothetical protein [Methylobacterium tardum]URD39448.1 hypothetical protein M6G65_14185 [Methylobacterium tardum]GJE51468.1 hypothetical protein GOFOIKOB_4527 [Methylobacterium tardum]GLS73634.1 hypothetical protein GCM10007890_56490 [Methylobacterium tardum]